MAMPDKHRVSINPQGKKTIVSLWGQDSAVELGQANLMKKDSMNKADESLIKSTKQPSQSATSRSEVVDTTNTTVVGTVQSSSRNDITMKNHLGKEVRVSLDFGSMRNGLSSTDEDSEEENELETFSQKAMAIYEDIWGERHFFDLPEADNDDEFLNLQKESPIILTEDNIEEDEEVPMIYNEIQPSGNVCFSYAREERDQEAETQSIMPIDPEFDESVGNIQGSTTSLSLVQSPTIDSPGMSSQYYQSRSTYATIPPSFDKISNTMRQTAVLERSSDISFSLLSDKDNRHKYKRREDLSYSMMTSRPSSRRREKNNIDIIIEEHNKKHAGKLGVTQVISKPLSPKVIQKKPTKQKGHKHSGSLEGFMVECQAQHSESSLSNIYQEYRIDHDEPTQSWMFEEEDSFHQVGQVQEVSQNVDSIQHMGHMGQIPPNSESFQHMRQGVTRAFTHEVQKFNFDCQSLPSPQRMDTQQPNDSFQQMGYTHYDWGSYPSNYISFLDETHSPLFPERNLWAPRATATLYNQSHYQFQMPTVQTQGFATQQYITVRDGNCAAVSPSESFGSERGSGQSSEASTSPSFSPCQLQTAYTHRPETMQEWDR
ncbi:uncharacterized protein Bfra_002595 [Botrytis fragariae]|uniref:Uncharacterized protein n=1 Tax=Botrytis fragariae TaxID=1964551 RepID=A0A8H6AYZ0_9HELO|nr:uncharacterized protein Bfra_002595 [Botrytis fragariae]KAF5876193.1 hypothetical protein Bfra_002595 [Botrytis fragariae]